MPFYYRVLLSRYVFFVYLLVQDCILLSIVTFQDVSSLGRGSMSHDCLCLMLTLCCQDVSSLGRGVHVS